MRVALRASALTVALAAAVFPLKPAGAVSPALSAIMCKGGPGAELDATDGTMLWRLQDEVADPAPAPLLNNHCRWQGVRPSHYAGRSFTTLHVDRGDRALQQRLLTAVRSGDPFVVYGHQRMGDHALRDQFDVRTLSD